MTTEEKKQFCNGCYNEFYNHGGVNGNTKECWSLKTAKKVKKKQVHINDVPPWKHQRIVEINSSKAEVYSRAGRTAGYSFERISNIFFALFFSFVSVIV